MSQEQTVIGAMSGTSLDGLDLCAVQFSKSEGKYSYKILVADTIPYNEFILDLLNKAFESSEAELSRMDISYGEFIGNQIQKFIQKNQLAKVDLIGSHGHTIFHEPHKGITVQIGNGKVISEIIGIPTINDFRIKDVKLGGQGAPLVPIGDKLLFGDYAACLNLGGISNISLDFNSERIAFDIGPCNLPLNKYMCEFFDQNYDVDGRIASKGMLVVPLLESLNDLEYYKKDFPKSLGVEWLNEKFYPLIQEFRSESPENLIRTIVEHETEQIARTLEEFQIKSCLVTGGGVHNLFFIDNLRSKTDTEILIPSKEIVDFKEALIFAFLGYLNMKGEINTLKSVTGASKDSIGGILHKPF